MRSSCKKHGYLDVHIARLEQCPFCEIDRLTAELEEAKGRILAYAQDYKSVVAELSRYREALEWISLRDRYGTTGHMVYGECGKVALKALAKEEI